MAEKVDGSNFKILRLKNKYWTYNNALHLSNTYVFYYWPSRVDSDATHVYRVSSYKACMYYHLTMWVLLGNTTFLLNVGLDRTGHMSFLTRQDQTPKFAGQVLSDWTNSGLIFLSILHTK